MRRRRGHFGRLLRGEGGQALVEFAIVSPLIVMILLFSIWFYELAQLKLKVQEAGRYAAWEATAYPLHDYGKNGFFGNLGLSLKTMASVSADAMVRYRDMDSATLFPMSMSHFAASWDQPMIIAHDSIEEVVPGGVVANLIVMGALTLVDFFSALNPKYPNYIASSLIGVGKGMGWAGASRSFGPFNWGFNRLGYFHSRISVRVKNNWFNNGVGRFIMPNAGVTLRSKHAVLADSWRLNDTANTYGTLSRPGTDRRSKLYKQIKRMYLVNSGARGVFKGYVATFKTAMDLALNLASGQGNGPTISDMTSPSVVAKNYTSTVAGWAMIRQDLPPIWFYDTAPRIGQYKKTFEGRGKNFMGCKRAMQLGCPTATLQQDNPFGDYIVR